MYWSNLHWNCESKVKSVFQEEASLHSDAMVARFTKSLSMVKLDLTKKQQNGQNRAMFVLPYIRLQSSNSFESCLFGKNEVVAKGFCRFWKANMALQPCTQSFSCRKFWRKIEATKLFSLCLWVQIMCLTPKVRPNKNFRPRGFRMVPLSFMSRTCSQRYANPKLEYPPIQT